MRFKKFTTGVRYLWSKSAKDASSPAFTSSINWTSDLTMASTLVLTPTGGLSCTAGLGVSVALAVDVGKRLTGCVLLSYIKGMRSWSPALYPSATAIPSALQNSHSQGFANLVFAAAVEWFYLLWLHHSSRPLREGCASWPRIAANTIEVLA